MSLARMILEGYKKYSLTFKGYYLLEDDKPEAAGIYCIYSGLSVGDINIPARLLYIGQAEDIRNRLSKHEHYSDWWEELQSGESILFSYAVVNGDEDTRKRIEAALIFANKPVCNTQSMKSFNYDTTAITITGKSVLLRSEFIVRKNEGSK